MSHENYGKRSTYANIFDRSVSRSVTIFPLKSDKSIPPRFARESLVRVPSAMTGAIADEFNVLSLREIYEPVVQLQKSEDIWQR